MYTHVTTMLNMILLDRKLYIKRWGEIRTKLDISPSIYTSRYAWNNNLLIENDRLNRYRKGGWMGRKRSKKSTFRHKKILNTQFCELSQT